MDKGCKIPDKYGLFMTKPLCDRQNNTDYLTLS